MSAEVHDNKDTGQFALFDKGNSWDEHWQGMPEFVQGNLMPYKTVYVHFEKREDMDAFAKLIGQTIGLKTKSVWYPEAEKDIVAHLKWESTLADPDEVNDITAEGEEECVTEEDTTDAESSSRSSQASESHLGLQLISTSSSSESQNSSAKSSEFPTRLAQSKSAEATSEQCEIANSSPAIQAAIADRDAISAERKSEPSEESIISSSMMEW